MFQNIINRLKFIILLVLVVLISLTFHPRFIDIGVAENIGRGGILYPYIIVSFVLLFVLSLGKLKWIKCKDIQVAIIMLLVIFLTSFATIIIYDRSLMGEIRAISICIGAMIIGWQMNLSEKQSQILVFLLAIVVLYVGYLQIFVRGNGLEIGQYFADQKNALGPLVATSGLLSLNMLNEKKLPLFLKIIYVAFAFVSFIIILTIRARAALFAMIVTTILLLILYDRHKNVLTSTIIVALFLVALFFILPNAAKQYVYDSIFYGSEGGDITSGRTERNMQAIEVIFSNPLEGNITRQYNIGIVHNYFLINLVNYGLFFSIPIIVLYLYILIRNIGFIARSKRIDNAKIGFFVLLIPFIVSFFEYTFPYGPGTATIMNFIFYGMALKKGY